MGQIISFQILNKIENDIKDFHLKIKNGEFVEIKKWLNKNIHQKGRLYDLNELVKKVTNQNINSLHFINYLTRKYNKIYQI
jgi:carboxypeptidase Taq